MCDSCSTPSHGRWWKTPSGFSIAAFLGLLAVIAVVGLGQRLYGTASASPTADCTRAAGYSIAYQATLTRHRNAGVRILLGDTNDLARKIDDQRLWACPPIRALRREASSGLGTLCTPCATRLSRLARPRPASRAG